MSSLYLDKTKKSDNFFPLSFILCRKPTDQGREEEEEPCCSQWIQNEHEQASKMKNLCLPAVCFLEADNATTPVATLRRLNS